MDIFLIKLIFVIICINNIIALNNDIMICPEGKYGQNCTLDCECNKWSSSNFCSKAAGRCLDCKFGHYGTNCKLRCYPTCKTNLCCAIKSSNFTESKYKLNIKNSFVNIKLKDKTLKIFVDYNVGYPLSIFNKTTDIHLENATDDEIHTYPFTIYKQIGNDCKITGKKYENYKIKFLNQNDLNLELPLPIILDETFTPSDKTINGIIGLGFYNSVNDKLFENRKHIVENIASYKKHEHEISVLFGDLFHEEKNYVHKLSFCKAENKNETEFNLFCKIEGFGSKAYSDVLQINDTYIQFSLDIDSKFVLPNNEAYTDYIKKYYFNEKNYYIDKTGINNETTFFCYETENINRLNEFGFVINHFFYFFSADNYFIETKLCKPGYSTFIINFSDKNPGLIFGKNLYNETQFTLDNEENKIYFYSKYVEYFSGEIKEVIYEDLSNTIDPLSFSFIIIGTSLFLNVVSFLIYFYFKRKKEINKLKDY